MLFATFVYMLDFFNNVIFEIGDRTVNIAQLVWMVMFLLSWIIVFRLFSTDGIKDLYNRYEVHKRQQNKLRWILGLLLLLTSLILLSWLFKIDGELISINDRPVTAIHIIKALCVIQAARLLDWTISNIFIHGYYSNREKLREIRKEKLSKAPDEDSDERKTSTVVQYIVYIIVSIFLLRSLNLDYNFYSYDVGDEKIAFNFTKILEAILILLVARLIVSILTQIILYGVYRNRNIDEGSQFALNQLLKYVIYVAALIIALDTLGIDMTLVLGGAAALLVGIGLGLQQTFNDFISGIVLLFERTISVGDVVAINGTFGTVQKIGMRSSIVETRDNMTIVVPNSKLVNDVVNNWSHQNPIVRFEVNTSVAYGTDTRLVKKLLLEAVHNVPRVLTTPVPFVRFTDFGDSGLLFQILFFTRDHLYNEDIRSDIRFEIDKLFRENNIEIPFPQRDIWIRKSN